MQNAEKEDKQVQNRNSEVKKRVIKSVTLFCVLGFALSVTQ